MKGYGFNEQQCGAVSRLANECTMCCLFFNFCPPSRDIAVRTMAAPVEILDNVALNLSLAREKGIVIV